jgi:hypothetical protein
VEKYFGHLTDQALFVAFEESGCQPKSVSKKNSNGSKDFCLFQINNEAKTLGSLDACIKRAYEKFVDGRVGRENWSAWYAVCTAGKNPKPKYPDIISNCT